MPNAPVTAGADAMVWYTSSRLSGFCLHCISWLEIRHTTDSMYILYIVYSIQYTVYSIHYTVYSIQYTLYTIQYMYRIPLHLLQSSRDSLDLFAEIQIIVGTECRD